MDTLQSADVRQHVCDNCRKGKAAWKSAPITPIGLIEIAAENGCAIHKVILAGIQWAVKNVSELTTISSAGLLEYDGELSVTDERGVTVRFEISMFHSTYGYQVFGRCLMSAGESRNIFSFNQHATFDEHHGRLRLLPKTTSSEETSEVLNSWLKSCLREHIICVEYQKRRSDEALRGVRFLQLTTDRAILVDDNIPSQYACLSHCWGTGQQILKTTTKNVDSRRSDGIALNDLPRTFQDAAVTCLRLGIDHIWIDSLCIIQDSLADWQSQASRMADIYENCIINIAATKADSPSSGCFSWVDDSFVGEPLPGYEDLYIRRSTPTPQFLEFNTRLRSREAEIDDWPALCRGWIYQELCLSPRVVHFGAQEIIWQCCSYIYKQSNGKGLHGFEKYRNPATILFRSPQILQAEWYRYVSTYSTRDLTYSKDRLPAIAAIAKRLLALRSNDQYLAGLWKETLLNDLLWTNVTSQSKGEWRSTYVDCEDPSRLPTWSWARSSNGVIWPWQENGIGEKFRNVHVVEAVSVTEGCPMSGVIKEAYIRVRAPLIELKTLRTSHDCMECFQKLSDWQELRFASITGRQVSPDAPSWLEMTIFQCNWDDRGSSRNESLSDIFALPLTSMCTTTTCTTTSGPATILRLLTVLMVRRKGDDDTYERLGTLELSLFGGYVTSKVYDHLSLDVQKDVRLQFGTMSDVEDAVQLWYRTLCEMVETRDTHEITLV